MFDELYRLLDEWQRENRGESIIRAIDARMGYSSPSGGPRIRTEIIDHVVKAIKERSTARPTSHDLRLGVAHQGLVKRGVSGADLVVKKLASLSTTSYIHCGKIHEDSDIGFQQHWNDMVAFVEFLMRYRPLVQENMLVPTPTYSFREDIGDFGHPDDLTKITIGAESLHLDLDIEDVEKQFFELHDPDHTQPPGAVDIYLPHLKEVDMTTIIRLRKNEQDAFIEVRSTSFQLIDGCCLVVCGRWVPLE